MPVNDMTLMRRELTDTHRQLNSRGLMVNDEKKERRTTI